MWAAKARENSTMLKSASPHYFKNFFGIKSRKRYSLATLLIDKSYRGPRLVVFEFSKHVPYAASKTERPFKKCQGKNEYLKKFNKGFEFIFCKLLLL
jgi:hypothetical protein